MRSGKLKYVTFSMDAVRLAFLTAVRWLFKFWKLGRISSVVL